MGENGNPVRACAVERGVGAVGDASRGLDPVTGPQRVQVGSGVVREQGESVPVRNRKPVVRKGRLRGDGCLNVKGRRARRGIVEDFLKFAHGANDLIRSEKRGGE